LASELSSSFGRSRKTRTSHRRTRKLADAKWLCVILRDNQTPSSDLAMDSPPDPEPPAPRPVQGGDKSARSRNISWVVLCGVLVLPGWLAGTFVLMWTLDFLSLRGLRDGVFPVFGPLAVTVILAVVVAWWGVKRGWNTPTALRNGWILGFVPLVFFLLWFASVTTARRIRPATIDKAVLNNARLLAAAADQYFAEHDVTSGALTDLVGPEKYVRALNTVAGESYPLNYTKGVTITVAGVAGVRTVTYAP